MLVDCFGRTEPNLTTFLEDGNVFRASRTHGRADSRRITRLCEIRKARICSWPFTEHVYTFNSGCKLHRSCITV